MYNSRKNSRMQSRQNSKQGYKKLPTLIKNSALDSRSLVLSRLSNQEEEERSVHDYPFFSMLNLGKANVNPTPYRMQLKRPSEFKNPFSMSAVIMAGATSLQPLKTKTRTRGRFLMDPDL